jgi:outer membrane usher protein
MSSALRRLLALAPVPALLGGLAGCATAPGAPEPAVVVKADALSAEYSSFNARILKDAAVIENSFAAALDANLEEVTRLESTYTRPLGEDRETLRIGDTISRTGMWGRSVRFGGVQFGTSTRPREDVITSRLATTGLAVLPTVEDALFASAGGSANPLNAQSVEVDGSIRGEGTTPWSLIATDALGRSQSIRARMIAPTRLVNEGCADFSLGFGKVRRDYALESNEYGPVFANTTVACAAPLGFTVEGHGEYLGDQLAAFGVGLARRIGPIGTASIALASSRAQEGEGWLARIGFEHTNSLFSLMYRARLQSREFREVGSTLLEDPIMERSLASIGIHLSEEANLSLAYATQTTWGRERTDLIALKQSMSVGRGSFSMSAGHTLESQYGSSVFFSYQRPFGAEPRVARSALDELEIEILGPAAAQP